MPVTFYGHPFASYCWKALIALYEADLPFAFEIVDLGDPEAAARFRTISPFGKMPALVDGDVAIFEASIVIEHLARTYPAAAGLLPQGGAAEREVRLWDRIFDNYVQNNMQKIVGDRLRPAGSRDRFGTDQARAELRTAYGLIEARMADREWVAGGFSLADCAAAPALHYAQMVEPFDPGHPAIAAYLARLTKRPSFARVLEGALPYQHLFPQEPT
jgi:glutathione S-transferase